MRKRFVLGVALLLVACSPGAYVLRAESGDSGGLVFVAYNPGMWPLGGGKAKLASIEIRVDHAGEIIWAIERSPAKECAIVGARPTFPLTYGQVPACFVQTVAPKPLVPNTLYRIVSDTGFGNFGGGIGYFRVDLTPVNLGWDDVHNETDGWNATGEWNAFDRVLMPSNQSDTAATPDSDPSNTEIDVPVEGNAM